jgi:GTP-binding protein Era
MQRTVDESLEDVDGVLFVLAADESIAGGDRFIASRVYGSGVPVVVALNKVDRVPEERVVGQIAAAAELGDFHELHPVSARTGRGVAALRETVAGLLPEGPAYFPEGAVTDLPLEARIAELVREQALALTREELPHAITAEVDEIDEGRVRVLLYVETGSQKGILVGKGGSMIREIGSRARPEIEFLLGRKVFLELVVKVRPRWRRDETLLERLGI